MTFPPANPQPRTDLGWLRHRSRRQAGAGQAGASQAGSASGSASSAVADFISGRAVRPGRTAPGAQPQRPRPQPQRTPPQPTPPRPAPPRPAPPQPAPPQPTPPRPQPAPAGGTSLDLSGPAGDTPLDLSAPTPAPAPPAPTPTPQPPAPAGDTSLDLSGPPPAPAPPTPAPTPPPPTAPSSGAVDSSLDLSGPPPAPAGRPFTLGPPAPEPRRATRPLPRVTAGSRTILTPRAPTVTLNRVQSGIGTLGIEAVCSPAVGDLRLGALYELADGTSSLVQRTIGLTGAPPRSRRPVIAGSAGQYEHLTVDLRQARALRRLLVYAFSESGRPLAWGGTLIATTFGQARIELPLDEFEGHAGQVALLSLYDVDGEFVLRAEREPVTGEVREVARRYGYDRIAWADDRTPAP